MGIDWALEAVRDDCVGSHTADLVRRSDFQFACCTFDGWRILRTERILLFGVSNWPELKPHVEILLTDTTSEAAYLFGPSLWERESDWVVESSDREAEVMEEINSNYSCCCSIALTMSERKSRENRLQSVGWFHQGWVLPPNANPHFAVAPDGDPQTDPYRRRDDNHCHQAQKRSYKR
jgi:hypothetical protein